MLAVQDTITITDSAGTTADTVGTVDTMVITAVMKDSAAVTQFLCSHLQN